ncbi:MAG: LysM peptidoglycan-binding domain-containing protein [Velocimicrobium sp.]
MLPKNVRQIGQIEGNKRIYIEDYVMTYARKIDGMAVLLGKQEEEGDDRIFYISGAVSVMNVEYGYPIILNNEDWSVIYEDVKKHFLDLEIMGWLLVRKDAVLEIDEEIRRIHDQNFKGSNKILFLYDKRENEEAFYLSNTLGDLKKQAGYYIYYEKNEPMQNYMLEKNPSEKIEEEDKEDAMIKVREIIAKKEPQKNDKKMINLMYGASTLLAAVVLVIGATMLDNYDKMKNMEETLNMISNNLDEEIPDETNVVEVEKIVGNTKQEEPKEPKDSGESEESSQVDTSKDNTSEEPEEPKAEKKDKDSGVTKDASKDSEKTVKEDEKAETEESDTDTKPVIAQESREYIVKEGDTLASISHEFYQSYAYVEKIQEMNQIDDSDMIYAGQKLQLP